MSDLANQPHHKPLENAADIIERFGGIRPMASKVDIAVTTIQGWKKRGVIPANRVDTVMTAAKTFGISLSDLVSTDGPAIVQSAGNINDNSQKSQEIQFAQGSETAIPVSGRVFVTPVPRHDDTYERIKAEQARAKQDAPAASSAAKPLRRDDGFTELVMDAPKAPVPKTVFVSLGLMVLLAAAVIGILIPKGGDRIVDQQDLVFAADDQRQPQDADESMFKGLVPEEWSQQLETFANDATETAQAVQEDLMGENAGTTQERMEKVSKYAENIVGEDIYGALSTRFSEMSSSLGGQETLDQTMSALHGMVMGGGASGESLSDDQFNAQLDAARQSDPSLGETLAGVPQQDLKAAAMLLTMTQMRDSLNRNKVPFEKDLQTLRGMIGEDDVELRAALDRLAPRAAEGVLTPTGVSNEFRGLAGDVLSASLNGEDLSLVERARDRMNDVFRVEKNGELISGSKQKQILDETKNRIHKGGYEEAIKYIRELLKSKELAHLRPWLKELEKNLDKIAAIMTKAQAEIDKGDWQAALAILRKELATKELAVLNAWIRKVESFLPFTSLEDAQSNLKDAIRKLEAAIRKIMKGGRGGGGFGHNPGGPMDPY